MRAFEIVLYSLAAIPLLTGALNLVMGLPAQGLINLETWGFGAGAGSVAPQGWSDPLLEAAEADSLLLQVTYQGHEV